MHMWLCWKARSVLMREGINFCRVVWGRRGGVDYCMGKFKVRT